MNHSLTKAHLLRAIRYDSRFTLTDGTLTIATSQYQIIVAATTVTITGYQGTIVTTSEGIVRSTILVTDHTVSDLTGGVITSHYPSLLPLRSTVLFPEGELMIWEGLLGYTDLTNIERLELSYWWLGSMFTAEESFSYLVSVPQSRFELKYQIPDTEIRIVIGTRPDDPFHLIVYHPDDITFPELEVIVKSGLIRCMLMRKPVPLTYSPLPLLEGATSCQEIINIVGGIYDHIIGSHPW